MSTNTTTVNNETLAKIKDSFSIKNFIADLPRMLNETFTIIYNCITKFYDPDQNKVKCNKLEASYIDATTIVAQNLTFKGSNGETYNYNDIAATLSALEQKINSIVPITQQQLDDLDSSALVIINM